MLGFIPGITTNFGDLSFAGHHSDARLLGLFQVSILHNIVHLLFGIAGSAMARTAAQARTYLVFGGAIYLVLFLCGLIVGQESAANFVPVNTADDFLHLILGIGMIGLGLPLTLDRKGRAAPLAENASGCDDQRYSEDRSTTNTARWRTGFDPGRHRPVRERNPGSGCFEPDRLTGSSSWHRLHREDV